MTALAQCVSFSGDWMQKAAVGWLMAAQGVGALFGAARMLRKREAGLLVRITFAAALGIALSLILFSTIESFARALPLIGLAGLFHVVCNIGMQTMAQRDANRPAGQAAGFPPDGRYPAAV